jgi:uncharacterized RDD family membrane protein YckC
MENNVELAGRWHRLGGAILDWIAVLIITMPAMMIVTNLYFPGAMDFSGSLKDSLMGADQSFGFVMANLVITIGAFLLLNGYILVRHGQTIGKKVIGMRIVTLEGDIPPFARVVLIRYILMMLITRIPMVGSLFSLIDVLFIFRRDKRCIHDLLAGTRVVKA